MTHMNCAHQFCLRSSTYRFLCRLILGPPEAPDLQGDQEEENHQGEGGHQSRSPGLTKSGRRFSQDFQLGFIWCLLPVTAKRLQFAMENLHFQWEKSLFLGPCSIAYEITRG